MPHNGQDTVLVVKPIAACRSGLRYGTAPVKAKTSARHRHAALTGHGVGWGPLRHTSRPCSQAVLLVIRWVEVTVFGDYRPRNMQQFPSGSTACYLGWLARCPQAVVERLNYRIVAAGTQRR